MTAKPVEWVLVVYYGSSAHRATYGRNVREPFGSSKYTKDYIQLSRKADFINTIRQIFPFATNVNDPVQLRYEWPTGSTTGALTWSVDRHHLKWETNLGAPAPWKMTLTPNDASAETIPGDPTHTKFEDAERELELLASRGAGQPYLVAVKLRDELSTLHLRVYLKNADSAFDWADLGQTPTMVQDLATQTSSNSTLAWSLFQSGGEAPSAAVENVLTGMHEAEDIESVLARLDPSTGQAVAAYLQRPRYGIFFDPAKNHNAWSKPAPLPEDLALSAAVILEMMKERFPILPQGDSAAEAAESDPVEVEEFQQQIEHKDYSVADTTATIKTRGSAQRAFADNVKANYSYRCAVTGIATREFLVASHIVPWAEDMSIRLDPANGICLSLIIDRAFEKGYLLVEDDLTLRVDHKRVGSDAALLAMLAPHDGTALSAPSQEPPNPEYLRRRRALVSTTAD
jgi:hypothetical protein